MPNYVLNKLEIIGTIQQVKKVLDSVESVTKDDKKILFDFNKIIPMPETLNINHDNWISGLNNDLNYNSNKFNAKHFQEFRKYLQDSPDKKEKDLNNFIQGIKNFFEHGYTSWYDWSINNWDTKWNAQDTTIQNNIISFDTAWSSPTKIFIQLSKNFPDITFKLSYSDESIGAYAGRETFLNGKIIEQYLPEACSKESYELAFELRPYAKEDYKLVNGNYQCNEEN